MPINKSWWKNFKNMDEQGHKRNYMIETLCV